MVSAGLFSPHPIRRILEIYRLKNTLGFSEDLIALTLQELVRAKKVAHLKLDYENDPFFLSLIDDIKHGLHPDVLLCPKSLHVIV